MSYLNDQGEWQPCSARLAAELLTWWELNGFNGPVPVRVG